MAKDENYARIDTLSDIAELPWQQKNSRRTPLSRLQSSIAIIACHVNPQSLMSHFDEYIAFVLCNHYDIIAVSETWLRSTIDDSFCSFQVTP